MSDLSPNRDSQAQNRLVAFGQPNLDWNGRYQSGCARERTVGFHHPAQPFAAAPTNDRFGETVPVVWIGFSVPLLPNPAMVRHPSHSLQCFVRNETDGPTSGAPKPARRGRGRVRALMVWLEVFAFASGAEEAATPNWRSPPHAQPGCRVDGDPRKMLPEFDYGGQFAIFRECLTDGRGRRFVDAEHGASMVGRPASGKRRSQAGILRSASTGAMVGCVTALDSSLVGASRLAHSFIRPRPGQRRSRFGTHGGPSRQDLSLIRGAGGCEVDGAASGAFFISTNPASSRRSTSRSAVIRAIMSSAWVTRFLPS
jgi:hypothetical protein